MKSNYMLRFSLTVSTIIIPLLIVINLVVNIFTIVNEGYSNKNLFMSIIIFFIALALVFGLGLLIGFISYLVDRTDIIQDNGNTITNGRLIINKDHIYQIKAKRFIFLYAFTIYTKPWKKLGTLTYYFNNKEELIDFIKEYDFFMKYVRENDLKKLEIK